MAQISTKEEITKVYLAHQRALFALALTYVNTIDAAQELVSDAIVAVFEASPTFTCEASCVCYFKQIIRNNAKNLLRKKYKIEPQQNSDLEQQMIQLNQYGLPNNEVELQLLLDSLLKDYSKDTREAFIAYVIDQEPIAVLAQYYGMKPDTLKKQINRMKTRISKTIPEKDMKAFLFMLMLIS